MIRIRSGPPPFTSSCSKNTGGTGVAHSGPLQCDFVVGTRPEAIKLAPVIDQLRREPTEFRARVITSGQQGEICRSALAAFGLVADVALDVGTASPLLAASTASVLLAFSRHIAQSRPDIIIVQGDTTTAMAAALAGFYAQLPIAHVEAGLRSGDFANPFPEEANREIIDVVSSILLSPTIEAQSNLIRAGCSPDKCAVTGNTVVDALHRLCSANLPDLNGSGIDDSDLDNRRLLLVTTHRRESWGTDLHAICCAVRAIADHHIDVLIALPVHPNPNVGEPVRNLLEKHPRIRLLPPLDYLSFLSLMRRAYLILTDSGGIQEEAPSLGVPVLVLRKTTERPEAVQAGLARIIGTDPNAILAHVRELLNDASAYREMTAAVNPFGDGRASERIAEVLKNWRAGRALLAESWSFVPHRPSAAI